MPEIVLATLNAKYIHAAFGLRYLMANLGPLRSRARLLEFDINQRPVDIAEALLAQDPRVIGLGIYIWNVALSTEVVAALKRVRPELIVILGGPEVSYEAEEQAIVGLADYVITGEADLKFGEVCGALLDVSSPPPVTHPQPLPGGEHGGRGFMAVPLLGGVRGELREGNVTATHAASFPKVIPAGLPDLSQLALPYPLYDDQDIAHRIIYVEASRGCPFTCEFCLSSLDIPVRQVPLPRFLGEMQKLLDRGVHQFKFVDRTFNLNIATSRAILEFFLERHQPGNFYHFEMIPDRLPEALRETIAKFPPGSLQFEVGIQTFNPDVSERIRRKQNYERLEENLRFLRNHTSVHIHADLIVGLPGENLESFGAGFDRLIALGPQEIQVGLLKRLRGTPIVRHDQEWQMVYNPHPPYEILQTRTIDFATMQKLRRFARYWDLVGNSGNFVETTLLLWSNVGSASSLSPFSLDRVETRSKPVLPSPFATFMHWSEWLYAHTRRTDSIALVRLTQLLFEYLTTELKLEPRFVAETLWRDYRRGGRNDKPAFLREFLSEAKPVLPHREVVPLKRQARHAAG